MRSPGINEEAELRWQLAYPGLSRKMAVKTECVCAVQYNFRRVRHMICAQIISDINDESIFKISPQNENTIAEIKVAQFLVHQLLCACNILKLLHVRLLHLDVIENALLNRWHLAFFGRGKSWKTLVKCLCEP